MQDINLVASCIRLLEAHLDEWGAKDGSTGPSPAIKVGFGAVHRGVWFCCPRCDVAILSCIVPLNSDVATLP
jgi:hypothetical protein